MNKGDIMELKVVSETMMSLITENVVTLNDKALKGQEEVMVCCDSTKLPCTVTSNDSGFTLKIKQPGA